MKNITHNYQLTKEGINMSESKIEIKIGEIKFSGEGEPAWLSEQLDKILGKAEDLIALAPPKITQNTSMHQEADLAGRNEISSKPLATWLREKNAETSQTVKFLATSVWLEAKGQNRLQTKDITAALSNANQRRLGNASDSLSKNITKGFCEKEGNQFYVTEEGKRSLGIN